MPFVDSLAGNQSKSSAGIDVLAVDLRTPVLRKLAECPDLVDQESFRRNLVDYYPHMKEYLLSIHQALKDMRQQHSSGKWIFIYSHLDDFWEIIKI
jgi:hypothetical protein